MMPIGPLTMLAIYITVWWTVLFAVLPLGTSQETHEPPTVGGAEEPQSEEEVHHHDLGLGHRLGGDHGADLYALAAAADAAGRTKLRRTPGRPSFRPSDPATSPFTRRFPGF